MSTVTLPAIKRSPSTVQYHILDAHTPSTRPTKFYQPRFKLSSADRLKTLSTPWFSRRDPMMPAYPYGNNTRYPEANEGLYGGTSVQSGNKISQGRNKGKTLRKWYPNVKVERIKSEALNKELTIPIAARVMRTIKKVGGLDEYVTGVKPARVKELGLLGWKLRWMVVNSSQFREKYRRQREEMGTGRTVQGEKVKSPLDETFEEAWSDPARRAVLVEKQTQAWTKLREKDERFQRDFTKNILSDNWGQRIPELSTLQNYNPTSLGLPESEVVVEVDHGEKNVKGVQKVMNVRNPANSVV